MDGWMDVGIWCFQRAKIIRTKGIEDHYQFRLSLDYHSHYIGFFESVITIVLQYNQRHKIKQYNNMANNQYHSLSVHCLACLHQLIQIQQNTRSDYYPLHDFQVSNTLLLLTCRQLKWVGSIMEVTHRAILGSIYVTTQCRVLECSFADGILLINFTIRLSVVCCGVLLFCKHSLVGVDIALNLVVGVALDLAMIVILYLSIIVDDRLVVAFDDIYFFVIVIVDDYIVAAVEIYHYIGIVYDVYYSHYSHGLLSFFFLFFLFLLILLFFMLILLFFLLIFLFFLLILLLFFLYFLDLLSSIDHLFSSGRHKVSEIHIIEIKLPVCYEFQQS